MMIEMADPEKEGFVRESNFIELMREVGLISEPIVQIIDNKKQEQR